MVKAKIKLNSPKINNGKVHPIACQRKRLVKLNIDHAMILNCTMNNFCNLPVFYYVFFSIIYDFILSSIYF